MEWSKFFPSADQLKLIQGIEAKLRDKKRLGDAGGISLMILGVLIQILSADFDTAFLKTAFQNILNFGAFLYYSITGVETALIYEPAYDLIGTVVVLIGIAFLLLSRHTKFLIKESEEPFRYTFWIEKFSCVGRANSQDAQTQNEKTGESDPLLMLHHDLMEKLNQRIQRLSLLDLKTLKNGDNSSGTHTDLESQLDAHINIDGNYAIREKSTNEEFIHVMPRVRIGSAGRPSTLANPVKFPLKDEDNGKPLSAKRYNQLVERVYSSVATEVYKQIESDVKEKIKLFPTNYLRAVAYFNEAEDYVKSNTVDAYDQAIILYKEARRYFQIAEARWKTKLMLIPFPLLWRFRVKFLHTWARGEIGYAKCLIYRRQLSALSGRRWNPLYEIPDNLHRVIYLLGKLHNRMIPMHKNKWKLTLEKRDFDIHSESNRENRTKSLQAYYGYPEDSWARRLLFRPSRNLFAKNAGLRFEAYVVNALAHHYLGATRHASEYLENAKSSAPRLSDRNPLCLLATAIFERDLDEEIKFYRKASEIAPDFEIAHFLLAQNAEMRFYRQDEIDKERSWLVIKKYEEVLKINPGNIAALARIGYISWLVNDLEEAKKRLEEGLESKAVVRQTFTGHLHYGLARIAAEQGDLQDCYDHYTEAIMADPGLGTYSMKVIGAYSTATAKASSLEPVNPVKSNRAVDTPYFDFIGTTMLKRFDRFRKTVHKVIKIKKQLVPESNGSESGDTLVRTMNVVRSFVLNDYGNACLNYYSRHGDKGLKELENAIEAYKEAIAKNNENQVAYFNLCHAYRYRNGEGDAEKVKECLVKAERLSPTWLEVNIASIKAKFRENQEKVNEKIKEIEEKERELEKQNMKNRAPSTTNQENDLQAVDDVRSVNSSRPRNDSTSDSKKISGQDLNNKVSDIKKELKVLDKKRKEIFTNFKDIVSQTKLSALEIDYEGNGVGKLPKSVDLKPRLDEFDLNILDVWLEFLFYSNNEKAKKSAEDLCNFLQGFHPEYFDYHYSKGLIYHNKKEYESAIELFKKAVTHREYNDAYHNMLGNAYFGIENYEEAIRRYKEASSINRQIPIYHSNRGLALGKINKWDEMIRYCKKAVELRKKTGEDYYDLDYYYELLAEAYLNSDKLNEFITEIEADEDLESIERGRVYNHIGNLLFKRKDYEDAVIFYRKATVLAPEKPIYQCNLGGAYGKLADWKQMRDHCKEALILRKKVRVDPEGLEYYYELLAEAYFNLDKLSEFEALLVADKKLKDIERARIQNRIGNLLFEKKDYRDAIIFYRKATISDAEKPIYQYNLGGAYGELGDWERMRNHCRKAVAMRKEVREDAFGLDHYYTYLAEASLMSGKLEEFITELENDGNLEGSKRGRVYNHIGNLLFEQVRYEDAVTYYREATILDTEVPIYQCNLGRACGMLGDWERMRNHCKKAVAMRKEIQEDAFRLDYYYTYLAEASLMSGKLEEFITELEDDGNLEGSKRGRVYNHIGNLLFEQVRYEDAVTYYREATILDAAVPIYQCNLGGAYGKLGDWERMRSHCRKAVEIRKGIREDDYDLSHYYTYLAEACFHLDKLSEFEADMKVESDLKKSERGGIYNLIGNLFYYREEYEKAINYYQKGVDEDHKKAVYYSNQGLALSKLSRLDEAVEVFQTAFELDRDKAIYANDLGNIYYLKGDFKEAEKYYRRAIELDSHTEIYKSNLDRALSQLT